MPKDQLPENVVMVHIEVPVFIGELPASTRRIMVEGRLKDDEATGCQRVLMAQQLIDQMRRSSHTPNNDITRIKSIRHVFEMIGKAATTPIPPAAGNN